MACRSKMEASRVPVDVLGSVEPKHLIEFRSGVANQKVMKKDAKPCRLVR